jgi:hypothetical protein
MASTTETMFDIDIDINIMVITCDSCNRNFLSHTNDITLCPQCEVLNIDSIEGNQPEDFKSCIILDTNSLDTNSLDTNNYYKNCKIVVTYKIVDCNGEEFFESETLPLIKSITDSDIRIVKGIKYIYPTNKNLQEHYKIEKIKSCSDEYTIVSAIIVNCDKVDLI